MSEDRDESTGQFTPSTDNLFGRDRELADAGFTNMPDPQREKPEGEFETPREAAEALTASRPAEQPAEVIIYHNTETGEPADPAEAVTLERAAADLASHRAATGDNGAKSISADFAAAIDKMRADAIQGDPKVAAELGVELSPDKGDGAEKPADTQLDKKGVGQPAVNSDGDLDPVLAEQIRSHPQVREFIAHEVAETQSARDSYSAGLETTRVHSLAVLAEVVPHLAGLPPAQFEQGLAVLSQVDPPAFQSAMNILGRAHTIAQAQQQDQQQRAYAAHQKFEAYAKSEDAKFRSMVGNDREKVGKVSLEVANVAAEMGIDREQLVHLLQTQPIMRDARFQKMMYDAAELSLIRKATLPKPSRAVPPVQRPGVAAAITSGDSAEVQRALAAFNASPNEKTGGVLLRARRANQRR